MLISGSTSNRLCHSLAPDPLCTDELAPTWQKENNERRHTEKEYTMDSSRMTACLLSTNHGHVVIDEILSVSLIFVRTSEVFLKEAFVVLVLIFFTNHFERQIPELYLSGVR